MAIVDKFTDDDMILLVEALAYLLGISAFHINALPLGLAAVVKRLEAAVRAQASGTPQRLKPAETEQFDGN